MLKEHMQKQTPDDASIDNISSRDTINDFFNFRNILITAFFLGLLIVIISLIT